MPKNTAQTSAPSLTDETQARLQKLEKIKELGLAAYPSWQNTNRQSIAAVLTDFERLAQREEQICLAGRLRSIRGHGGSTFANLEDASGKIQIYFKKDEVGDEAYQLFSEIIDLGDFVSVTGSLFITKRGEKTLLVKKWQLLSKSLLPMPEKFHGLSDVETRFRKRYLDLIANPEAKEIALKRIQIIQAIREFFNAENFLEVETPILQPIAGGATAKPFVTHHNALNIDLFLRVAPELYLKRLIVGGFEKIYEIARCFRNEGIDFSHNPEFTQIEFYLAYANYEDLMKLMEKFFPYLLSRLGMDKSFEYGGQKINLAPPYPRKTFREILIEYAKLDIEEYPDQPSLYDQAKKLKIEISPKDGLGKIMDEIFKTLARPKIIQPTFMIDHPVELSPLAKRRADNPAYTERMQLLVAGGFELCNGFSELNDPLDQETRFKEQEKLRDKGDEEAHQFDEDFVTALKHGLPPTAGLGMGIDRLAALLTDSHNIKEVILFPTLKPESGRLGI
ncbi:MAG: lysine--tRNA ligase [Candidatus Magasanikbacteria bacterium]|nr:lysine--tRNA ligase [Candidatus Magasanikbacteria bacterium]